MTNSATDSPQDLMDHTRSVDTAVLMPAQGIQCGDLNLAFLYAWAQTIVEDFDLTPVPNAPEWLMGAANIGGEILPVFDLASWVAADAPGHSPVEPRAGQARLLVGGHGGNRAAIAFSGAARMVRFALEGQRVADGDAVPTRLRGIALAGSETTPLHWVVDAQRLFDKLARELST